MIQFKKESWKDLKVGCNYLAKIHAIKLKKILILFVSIFRTMKLLSLQKDYCFKNLK
jgi:hypothetical protein